MRVSIGILAYNEAASIGDTIAALFRQTLFTDPDGGFQAVEVICVPNGCTDGTARIAREALTRHSAHLNGQPVKCSVRELPEAGKANAWNYYVHEFSDPAADYIFLMDADVQPRESSAFLSLIQALERSPSAQVSTPHLVKHIALKPRKTLFDRLSLAISRMNDEAPCRLAGGLYCARARALREIWLPPHLLGEDGFLRAMILTDQFRSPEDLGRIIRDTESSLIFESCATLGQFFRHERRLAMGTALNTILYSELAPRAGHPGGIARWIREQNASNPDWPLEVVRKRASERGGHWLISSHLLFGRFHRLWHSSPLKRMARLPLAFGAFLFDLPVLLVANHALRRGWIRGAW